MPASQVRVVLILLVKSFMAVAESSILAATDILCTLVTRLCVCVLPHVMCPCVRVITRITPSVLVCSVTLHCDDVSLCIGNTYHLCVLVTCHVYPASALRL